MVPLVLLFFRLPNYLFGSDAHDASHPHRVLTPSQFCTPLSFPVPTLVALLCLARHIAYSSTIDSYYDQGSSGILALNPLLSASGMGMLPTYYNVTKDVQYIQLQPGCPQNSLDAPAVHPSCPHLVLSVPLLPLWPTIEVRNPRGVTVRDVLIRIRDVLNRSVSSTEMSSVVSPTVASASEYFRARTYADPREFAQGVKRIDFLGPNVLFAGLSRSMDGRDRWEVRFALRT